jgi:Na+-translocating ferredoxin:NAD+ oxidoreductase subunit G
MGKRESTFGNMVMALFLVTLIASASLGFVNDLTREAIDKSKEEAKMEAIKKVLPAYDEILGECKIAPPQGGDSLEFYPAYKNEIWIGTAIKTYTNRGFGGYISIMAGIDASGNFCGYEILEHEETPGLGSKMDTWFKDPEKPHQEIIGKNPGSTAFFVSKDGGDIDAITASTITSRAFLDALRRAWETYKENNPEPGKTAQLDFNKGGSK